MKRQDISAIAALATVFALLFGIIFYFIATKPDCPVGTVLVPLNGWICLYGVR